MEIDQNAGFLLPKSNKTSPPLLTKEAGAELAAMVEPTSFTLFSSEKSREETPPVPLQQGETEGRDSPSGVAGFFVAIPEAYNASVPEPEADPPTVTAPPTTDNVEIPEAATPIAPLIAPEPRAPQTALAPATLAVFAETGPATSTVKPSESQKTGEEALRSPATKPVAEAAITGAPGTKPEFPERLDKTITNQTGFVDKALTSEKKDITAQAVASDAPSVKKVTPNSLAIAAISPPSLSVPLGLSESFLQEADSSFELANNIKINEQSFGIQKLSPQTPRIFPSIGSQITVQLQSLLSQNSKQVIELRLDPPELGRVTIHLSPLDQSITAQVSVDRPETLDLMRRHADLLLSALEKAGFLHANLSFQQENSQKNPHESGEFQGLVSSNESEATAQLPLLPATNGRLDIRL